MRYKRFDDFLLRKGFNRCRYHSCVYVLKREKKYVLYLLFHVDDIVLASFNMEEIKVFKEKLKSEFETKDLGPAKRILGMDIIRNRKEGELLLSQEGLLRKVVESFRMHESKPVTSHLGSLTKLSSTQAPKTKEETIKMESCQQMVLEVSCTAWYAADLIWPMLLVLSADLLLILDKLTGMD
jgi:hypothetical protein